MEAENTATESWHERKRRQLVKLAAWTVAWLVTMALATFGPHFLWSSSVVTIAATGLNLLVGVGMIVANRDHLRTLDELEQRMHLEAMAITLGVGLIVGLAYSNLDTSNVVPFDAEISHLVIVMSLTYLSSLKLLMKRFR